MYKTATLDELDFSILSFLQNDGRIPFTMIAEKLDISVGTALTRFNKMIDDGIINIIGRVDPEKAGFRSYAHIAVSVHPATLIEVSFLALTSGKYDPEGDAMCRDNEHLMEFVNRLNHRRGSNQNNYLF